MDIENRTAATVMLVSGGYPGAYTKGIEINGVDDVQDTLVFHAGTTIKQNKLATNGGRVMALTSYGNTMEEALTTSYSNAERIEFAGKYFRKDIGFDLL